MTNIEVISFKPKHIEQMKMKSIFDGDESIKERTCSVAAAGNVHAKTLVYRHKVLAIIGGDLLWDGVFQVWSVMDDHINELPVAFARCVKKVLNRYIIDLNLHRVQVDVRCGFPKAIKWVNFLGFKYEGIMQKYGPEGADYYRFVRLD